MDSDITGTVTAPRGGEGDVDAGAYEVLRRRLSAQAGELVRRAEALNVRRTEEFGSTGLRLLASEQVRTERASVPRDVVAVGGQLLFGFERGPGARGEAGVEDVLLVRDSGPQDDPTATGLPEANASGTGLPDTATTGAGAGQAGTLLGGEDFRREFSSLHRYFRDARLLRLRRVDGRLLAVFRTGENAEDIRVLRWALGPDGSPGAFLDAQGERDHVFPPSHDFDWTVAGRDAHVTGRHPHIAVGKGGGLFVDTLGGTLTVKVTDDTESPDGIYEEPVDEPLQSLADADVAYAEVGPLVLLRVRPYKEQAWRYLVFNSLLSTVRRLDGIGPACHRLPEDQGIIFPGGYYLTTGTAKTFDTAEELTEPVFEGAVRSPNGEDVLYVFRSRDGLRSLLLPYNLIRQEVATPLTGRGHALLDDGTLVLLRDNPDGPARVHPVQRWQTPYVSDTYAAARPAGTGPLARTGNADLVRGISDCLALAHGVRDMTPTTAVYGQLAADCARAQDRYHWLSDSELGSLDKPLRELRATAQQVLAEFTAVQELTGRAADALEETAARITALVRRVRGEVPGSASAWVERLTELRRAHGHLATVGEMRYADVERIAELSARTEDDIASAAQRAVSFLARDDAFDGYHEDIAGLVADAGALETVRDASAVTDRLSAMTEGLATVTDVVAGLEIGDATVRTSILERIAEVLGGANRARATLDARRRELLSKEGRAEFAAEFALLGQAVTGALAAADTPEACDDQLARLLLQLENLESRFAEFDDFLAELSERRTEVYEAFSARKQTLQDERARRAERLAGSAGRVLETVARRVASLEDLDAVHTYFASDPMVAKVRRTADELRELGDPVRAEELDGRLKAARQEAGRALRDRTELYADGGSVIRLGRHRFAVNTQPFDLTLVPAGGKDGEGQSLAFALTGTDYRAPVTDPAFTAARPYWEQLLPSENASVYRAEHLAARLLDEHGAEHLAPLADSELATLVRESAAEAYDEGYTRGVHDEDATAILAALLRLHAGAGLLRHEPAVRAAAQLFWAHSTDEARRTSWTRRAVSLARARDTFGLAPAIAVLQEEWAAAIGSPSPSAPGHAVAAYLFEELTTGPAGFVVGSSIHAFLEAFHRAAGPDAYGDDLAALGDDPAARRQLVEGWLAPYAETAGAFGGAGPGGGDLAEAVAVELCPELERYACDAPLTERLEGLLGDHPRIAGGGALTVRIDELLARTAAFRTHRARLPRLPAAAHLPGDRGTRAAAAGRPPAARDVGVRPQPAARRGVPAADRRQPRQAARHRRRRPAHRLAGAAAARLAARLRQDDADGVRRRPARHGPRQDQRAEPRPRRDLLDPDRAPSATARQEIEKINFALEAGNNTLLYLDDIQHTSPELLQKFIPLCDATRRIEGVRDGEPRSYDLRGKRFAVCMAGNPYTESGEQFRIPDMLANRADVWNLGEVLSGRDDVFALSFVENALTANPVLAPLAARSRDDLALLVRLAGGNDPAARAEHLEHPYSAAELDPVLAVLRHLLTARDTVLAVNAAYIASAAQTDATRTEPPFRLQGSYRNMNKIAERIVPVMNDDELSSVVDDHYAGEAQTLTTGAEANLLKLAALRSTLTAEQAGRWAAITASYVRTQALGGPDGDPMTRAVAALGLLADRIAAVETAIQRAADPRHLLAGGPPGPVGGPRSPAASGLQSPAEALHDRAVPNHAPNDRAVPNHHAKITNTPH